MKGKGWEKSELPTAGEWAPAAIKISLKTEQEIGELLSAHRM